MKSRTKLNHSSSNPLLLSLLRDCPSFHLKFNIKHGGKISTKSVINQHCRQFFFTLSYMIQIWLNPDPDYIMTLVCWMLSKGRQHSGLAGGTRLVWVPTLCWWYVSCNNVVPSECWKKLTPTWRKGFFFLFFEQEKNKIETLLISNTFVFLLPGFTPACL